MTVLEPQLSRPVATQALRLLNELDAIALGLGERPARTAPVQLGAALVDIGRVRPVTIALAMAAGVALGCGAQPRTGIIVISDEGHGLPACRSVGEQVRRIDERVVAADDRPRLKHRLERALNESEAADRHVLAQLRAPRLGQASATAPVALSRLEEHLSEMAELGSELRHLRSIGRSRSSVWIEAFLQDSRGCTRPESPWD